jgi:hypothetical protein
MMTPYASASKNACTPPSVDKKTQEKSSDF